MTHPCLIGVDWGTTSPRRPNPWVTLDALSVLAAAGRLDGAGPG